MELILLDDGLQIVGQPVELFSSLQWNRAYYEPGTFELHAPAGLFGDLRAARYLYRRDTGEAALIECVRYSQEEDGKIDCSASGRFPEALLGGRVIDRTFSAAGDAEDVLRSLVDACAIHPADAARVIPGLRLGERSGIGGTLTLQTTGANLLEKLLEAARAFEAGIRVRLDFFSGKLVFEVWRGLDRTQGQNTNSWAVFSQDFENLRSLAYTRDARERRNFAYVAGEGEGAARVVVTVVSTDGQERRELYVDARDLQRGEMLEADYLALLRQRGEERLAQYAVVETMEGVVDAGANLVYRRDFDLGDKCTCVGPSVLTEARITQIQEVYEPNGMRISASFGDGYVTDLSKFIKREVS